MSAYVKGIVTCDHKGCKAQTETTFLVSGFDGGETHLYVQSLPLGWIQKRPSWFVLEKVFLCPEHNASK